MPTVHFILLCVLYLLYYRPASLWTIPEESVWYFRRKHLGHLLDVYYNTYNYIGKEAFEPLSPSNGIPRKSTIVLSLTTQTGEQKEISVLVKVFMEDQHDSEKQAAAYLRLDQLIKMKKEIQWYKVVIPTIEKFQNQFNPGETYLFGNMFATCIGARMSIKPDSILHLPDISSAIVLEHPAFRGYKDNIIGQKGFDRATTTKILRQMARFHASSIAMRIKNEAIFRETILPIAYLNVKDYAPVPSDKTLLQELITEQFKDMPLFKTSLPGLKKSQQFSRLFDWIFHDKEDKTWHTICHTKYGIPNILTNDANEDASESSKLIEMCKFTYNSCFTELAYFIYTSVETETLNNRLLEMLEEYYKEFNCTLDKHQVPSTLLNSEYSRDSFMAEFKAVEKRILTNLIAAVKVSSCEGYKDRITCILAAYSR